MRFDTDTARSGLGRRAPARVAHHGAGRHGAALGGPSQGAFFLNELNYLLTITIN